jgi:FimV-like protein
MNIEKTKTHIELATTYLEDGAFHTARDILQRVVNDIDADLKQNEKIEAAILAPTKPKRGRPPKHHKKKN